MMPQKRILIVEDNAINRELLCEILSEHYSVLEAENGQQAFEILSQDNTIALILLDVMMPVMDGYTFLDRLKADPEFSLIPVIVMTQSDSEEDEVAALSHGATDFLPKPYRPKVILHRIAGIINLRETAAMVNQFQYDWLTGVYSKEFFYQKAKEILEQNPERRFDIVCSNVENFKLFNDLFGTGAGDRLLCEMARCFKECSGDYGICGRLGADRFMCLNIHQEYRDEMFTEVLDKVNSLMENSNNIVIKWGIYEITDLSVPVEQMCDRAFLAAGSIKRMYQQYFAYYDDALRSCLLRRQAITDAMETALSQDQFMVYFQPKFSLNDYRIAGAEALIRWNHPELGPVSPGEFIPLFEKSGFITSLDRYVWKKVCALIRKWKDKGYTVFPVSVNVSRADLYQTDFADTMVELVRQYGVSPAELHLEITESAYTENASQIINTVEQLWNRGFTIEMDDFGSGYSSLNMLNQMHLDVLKLDMKFIQSETAKKGDKGIIRYMVRLAHWMKLSVVAKGVETYEQVERLREMGCDYVQGYYFSEPVPDWEYEEIIKKYPAVKNNFVPQTSCSEFLYETEKQQSILDTIPGGVAVIRCNEEGIWVPAFLSEGFAAMTGMSLDGTWKLYSLDAMAGVHPDDQDRLEKELNEYFQSGREYTELVYRLKKGEKDYIWVRNALTMSVNDRGEKQVYCVYRDMTQEMEERDVLRRQYQERLNRHFRNTGTDVLVAGHSNISRNRIMEIMDYTNSALLQSFGSDRNAFITGISSFVVKDKERHGFQDIFLNDALISAYENGQSEVVQRFFIRLPHDKRGRYVQFKVNIIEEPDTGDMEGFFAITDVTEEVIQEKMMRKLSSLGYDMASEVDLYRDVQKIISKKNSHKTVTRTCSYKEYGIKTVPQYVMPEDQDFVRKMLNPEYILERLKKEDCYSFSYSMKEKDGSIREKNMIVASVDRRLGRICLVRTDITNVIETKRKNKKEQKKVYSG